METCGCEYESRYLGPNDEWAGDKITYCAMHASAPDMLEMLKVIYAWLQTDHGRHNLRYKPEWVDDLCVIIGKE